MKLLILTQKVDMNDNNLGSFHRWIVEFAKYCEQVTVICLQEGKHDLPNNVIVHSLGKEHGTNKFSQILRFAFCVLRSDYQSVFVHMNPEYIVLAGWYWRLLRKKVALWYTHKHVDLKLRIAEKFANIIFTASAESFRLGSVKVMITGHGIDTDFFSPGPPRHKSNRVLTAGRITPSKHIREIIEVVGASLIVAGETITESDLAYKKELMSRANFIGAVAYPQMPDLYRSIDLFVNASTTGSIDRAVLEALACEVTVVTTNEAFKQVPDIYAPISNLSLIIEKNLGHAQPSKRDWVIENHSIKSLIPKIIHELA
ncbi:MAG TPA: glycosyltransferase [Candidatus Paceibacterota bacterium]